MKWMLLVACVACSSPSVAKESACQVDHGEVVHGQCSGPGSPDGGDEACVYTDGTCRMCKQDYCK